MSTKFFVLVSPQNECLSRTNCVLSVSLLVHCSLYRTENSLLRNTFEGQQTRGHNTNKFFVFIFNLRIFSLILRVVINFFSFSSMFRLFLKPFSMKSCTFIAHIYITFTRKCSRILHLAQSPFQSRWTFVIVYDPF